MSELPSVYAYEIRAARKTHRCCECKREIRPGEKYYYHHGVWEGQGASYKQCERCGDLAQKIASECNSYEGLEFGSLSEAAMSRGFENEWAEIEAAKGGEG